MSTLLQVYDLAGICLDGVTHPFQLDQPFTVLVISVNQYDLASDAGYSSMTIHPNATAPWSSKPCTSVSTGMTVIADMNIAGRYSLQWPNVFTGPAPVTHYRVHVWSCPDKDTARFSSDPQVYVKDTFDSNSSWVIQDTPPATFSAGVQYCFLIVSYNGDVEGEAFNIRDIATATQGVMNPSTVRNVTAAPADNAAVMSWVTPASDGGLPIWKYRMNAYIGGELKASQPVQATEAQVRWIPYLFVCL